jgi:hypothetical protein
MPDYSKISRPGLIPVKIENQGTLLTTQVNKINFLGSVSASIGDFNDITITVGIPETASFAISSSYALTASYLDNYLPPFPFTGSALITGSLGITGSFSTTNNVFLTGLINQTTPVSHVVTFDNTTGRLYITASSAFGGGGGGGSTPGGNTDTIQFNNAGVLDGSDNFKIVGSNFIYLTGSLLVTGSTFLLGPITGSSFTGSFTGSLLGTSSFSISSSQTISSSYAFNSTSASFATTSLTASFVNPLTQSIQILGNTSITGSLTVSGSITGSLFGTASFSTSSSFANTASFVIPLTQSIQILGNTSITGSLRVSGSITGSLFGTASFSTSSSFAISASQAVSASYAPVFPFTGSAIISGSLITTGSINVSENIVQSTMTQEFIVLPSAIAPMTIVPVVTKALTGPVSMFLEYQIVDTVTGTNQRTGLIMANFNNGGTPTNTHTEMVTGDIGNTSAVTFSTTGPTPYQILANNTSMSPYTFKAILKFY